VQVTRATFIPLLTSAHSDRLDPAAVREECFGDLTVVYTFGPDFGRRVVTHADLDQLQLPPQMLRRSALEHLEVLSSRAEFHGQPPALMLSFEGLESSLLLATDFWSRLEGAVPGELVVGVPARDVVIVTGTQSGPGLEKARRCVERVFFAGGEHLVARGLFVRRGRGWEPFDPSARRSGRPAFGPGHQHGVGQPPRQYQEHPSWPQIQLQPASPARPMTPPPGPARRRPMHPLAPAAQMGAAAMDMTGSQRPVSASPYPPAQQRPRYPSYQPHPAEVAEAAQYSAVPYPAVAPQSAVPYSAMPYSAAPYSAVPYSAVPHSMMPNSAVTPASVMPQSAVPYSAAPYSSVPYTQPVRSRSVHETGSWAPSYEETPAYREPSPTYVNDQYSTGSVPRQLYPDYGTPAASESPTPTYPASWGTAPEPASRPDFRSGPRARFSR
jgi:hypothetical protein